MSTEKAEWGNFDNLSQPTIHSHFLKDQSPTDQSPTDQSPTDQSPINQTNDWPKNSAHFLLGDPMNQKDRYGESGFKCLTEMLEGGLLQECFSVEVEEGGVKEDIKISLVDNDLIWKSVMENYGCVLPVEWNHSIFKTLTHAVLHVGCPGDGCQSSGCHGDRVSDGETNKCINNNLTTSATNCINRGNEDEEKDKSKIDDEMGASLSASILSRDSLDGEGGVVGIGNNGDGGGIMGVWGSGGGAGFIREPISTCTSLKEADKKYDKYDIRNGATKHNLINDDDDEDDVNLDMHSLVRTANGVPLNEVKGDEDAPMFTAEQVISELEEMMEEMSADDRVDAEDGCVSGQKVSKGGGCYDNIPLRKLVLEDVDSMSVHQLGEVFDEVETLVAEYSEALICELARRDELEYDLEVKNRFISLFLKLQRKKRSLMATTSNKKVAKVLEVGRLSAAEKIYLTTTIPYHPQSPPSSHLLTLYIDLLLAILQENPNLPLLLTQYILKVVCPT